MQVDHAAKEVQDALDKLEGLRVFRGAPAQFWPEFLQVALSIGGSDETILILRERIGEEAGPWREAFCWPPESELLEEIRSTPGELERLGAIAESSGSALSRDGQFLAVRVTSGEPQRSLLLIVHLRDGSDPGEMATRLRLVGDAPLIFQLGRGIDQALQDSSRFAIVLDLLVLLNAHTRFIGAAMTLCNELATRYRSDRVSLGWIDNDYARVQALSHMEKFERKMASILALELAMDEAVDQDDDVIFPPPPDSNLVYRDHELFAKDQASGHLVSLPIRLDSRVVGILTLERTTSEFTAHDLQVLRLLCDQMARRLEELKRLDRWFGARLLSSTRDWAKRQLGPEHALLKLGAIIGLVLLVVCSLIRVDYRVESPFLLRADILAQVPAPFDGFLDEVHYRLGDPVRAGQPLLSLDTRDLLLQEASGIAEHERHLAEAQKAESAGDAAQMRIARASAEEAQVKIDLARYRLKQAAVLAPFDGFVVEGELRERLSAPLKQGEVLVKVAKIEAMYAELAMPERDIHEIKPGQTAEIAFSSRPQFGFPVRIDALEPAAQVRDNANAFIVRATFLAPNESWWRPGMTGICKVSTGKRNLLWIFTHRTVDFLRLYLWW